ncbi:MAG: hypothetical protein ACOH2N_19345 [Devosia sp.]
MSIMVPIMGASERMTPREIDIHTQPSMLTTLRLPSFHKLWQEPHCWARTHQTCRPRLSDG